MSYAEEHTVTITTGSTDGAGTGYSDVLTGAVNRIHYTKTDFSDGVDFSITSERTGLTIWAQDNVNASAVVAPRKATHTTAGVAALYAAGGAAVLDKIALANDRIKITVTNGGNSKTGTFTIITE